MLRYLSPGLNIADKHLFTANVAYSFLLDKLRMWHCAPSATVFEQFNEQWWIKQKNQHFFSKASGALCKLHSECCYPLTLETVAKKVVAVDYDAVRTWSQDPIIKMADVFFENRKGEKHLQKESNSKWSGPP